MSKIAKQLADALDPSSPHSKRLKKLDRGNKVATAISADPTCAATTTATDHPLKRHNADRTWH